MTRHQLQDDIPRRGDLIEVRVTSPRENHLGEEYDLVTETVEVTRIIKNRSGKVAAIKTKGFFIKIVKISYVRNCFYVVINRRRLVATIDIIEG